ncbi:MAG: Rieske 2Fe-2S domain-containing protein [Flavitalea sp.]
MQATGDGYTWYKIDGQVRDFESSFTDNRDELHPNKILTLEVGGRTICVAKFNETYFGFAHKCPHAGVPLSDGWIDEKGQVVCPKHEYKFNLKNGYNISEGYFLKTYPVEIRKDGIFIRL